MRLCLPILYRHTAAVACIPRQSRRLTGDGVEREHDVRLQPRPGHQIVTIPTAGFLDLAEDKSRHRVDAEVQLHARRCRHRVGSRWGLPPGQRTTAEMD